MKAMRSFTERMSDNINRAISQELGDRNVHKSEIAAGKASLVCQSQHNENGSTCIFSLEKDGDTSKIVEVVFGLKDYRIIRYSRKKNPKDAIPIMGASSKIIATSEKIIAASTPAIVTEAMSREDLEIEIEADRLERIRIEQEKEWIKKNK